MLPGRLILAKPQGILSTGRRFMPQESPDTCNREFIAGRLPWLVAGVALALYLVTLNSWVTPGSLATVAAVSGFDWQPQLFQPLLLVVTLPLRLLPADWVPMSLNFLSALLAAGTLGLLARSVALLPHNRLPEQRSLEPGRHSLLSIPAAWAPVVLASAACGLQLTFWQHSITGTGEMVDLLLLAGIVRALLEFRVGRQLHWLAQGCLLMGLAVANSWAFIGFVPLFLLAVGALGWKELLSWKAIGRLALWGGIGFSLFLVLPIVQALSPDTEMGLLRALRHTAGSYLGMLKSTFMAMKAAPHIAIIMASGSLVPLLFVSIRWRRYAGSTGWVGELIATGLIYLTHLLLLAACLWAVFDLPFSPRRAVARLGVAPPLLTFICLAALGLGYYSGFFLLLFSRRPPGRRRPTPTRQALHTAGRYAMLALTVLAPALLLLKNLPLIRDFNAPVYRDYARLAVAQLPPGPAFLLSDDALRYVLVNAALAGRPDSRDYLVLDTRALAFRSYWNYLHRAHPDRWPERPPGLEQSTQDLPTRFETPLLTFALRSLVSSNTVCYLMPGFGTFFDALYREPRGIVYPLALYPRAALNPPALSEAVLAGNAAFWKTNSQPLRDLLSGQRAARDRERKSLRQLVFARLGLEDELPPQTLQTAGWLANAANAYGVRLQSEGWFKEATWYFEEALRLRPDNLPASFNLGANTNLVAGRSVPYEPPAEIAARYGKKRDWSLVMRESGPFDHPTFCYDFGLVFGQSGFLRQGAQQFDRCRRLAPDFFPGWLRLGGFLNALKLPEHTLQMVTELRREPALRATLATNAFDVALLEAEALFQKEDRDLAHAVLRDAIEAAPPEADTISRATDLYIRHQRWAEAEQMLNQCLAARPDDPRPLLNLGYLNLRRQSFTNALPPLTRVLELKLSDEQQAVARLNRAICFLRLDQLDAAVRDYEKLLELNSKSFQAHFGLGEIAVRRGRTEDAIRHFRSYLTNAPAGLDEAEGVRQRLRELELAPR